MDNTPAVILASASPRRKALLELAGLRFTVRSAGIAEEYPPGMPVEEIPLYLARRKAEAVRAQSGSEAVIIAADTVVVAGGALLGKPRDLNEAGDFLNRLSGTSHEVITGVCVLQDGGAHVFSELTRVFFRALTAREITYYVDTFRPLDKAGAYGIQEWIGVRGVERIEGDYFNVVGLPVSRLVALLNSLGE